MTKSAADRNRALYDDAWKHFRLQPHTIWSAWSEVEPFTRGEARALEIGPGKWPHLPVDRAHFHDLSEEAIDALRAAGGQGTVGNMPLPYPDGAFDLACFFELLEHVDDDVGFLAEVARVVRSEGIIFLSCPMNPTYWTHYDSVIGHVRRYRAQELAEKLASAGFAIERVCARDDRMSRVYGWLFGFGVEHFTGLTTALVARALPEVAGKTWDWQDGPSLADAERRGGVTLRARRGPSTLPDFGPAPRHPSA